MRCFGNKIDNMYKTLKMFIDLTHFSETYTKGVIRGRRLAQAI
jgi:hypothetical protein